MKKVIALLLVAMMFAASVGYAESDTEDNSVTRELKTMVLLYDLLPDSFGEYELVKTYVLYDMYLCLKSMNSLGSYASIKSYDTDGGLLNISKNLVKGNVNLLDNVSGVYLRWAAGEITFEECREKIMTFVNITLESEEKAKE